jgi:outer membrane protein assembly factor BamB
MKTPRLPLYCTLVASLCLACGAAATDPPEPEKGPPKAGSPAASTGADWPALLGPRRDGKSPEGLDLRVWQGEGPPLLWQRATGEGFAGAVVAEGGLYFFDRHGDQARLVRLDPATGETRWRAEYPTAYVDAFDYSPGPRASPVVDGDRVYTFGSEGRLRCHATADGALLWEVDTAAEYGVVQNFFGVGSAPWVEGDLLIVAIGGSPPESPNINSGQVRSHGTAIVAFDKKSGKERYRLGEELASYTSPLVATVAGERWGFYFARGGLLAFHPTAGEVIFHYPYRARKLYSVNAATPVVVDDKVFLTESYEKGGLLLQLPADKGGEPRVLWQDPRRGQALAAHWSTPVHHQGILYGSHGESSGSAEWRAVDLATGQVRWSQRGLGRATQIYADGHLIVLGERGLLLLVEATPEAYREVARVDLGERLGKDAWNPPTLAHGRLYLRGSRALVALDLRTPNSTEAAP